MKREDKRKEEGKGQKKGTDSKAQNGSDSAMKPSDRKDAADEPREVKDENIPVTFINTAPDVPKKHQ